MDGSAHYSYIIAVNRLQAGDQGSAIAYVRECPEPAVDIICTFPKLAAALRELNDRIDQIDARADRQDAVVSELSKKVQELSDRQAAEGQAIAEIIRILSPSFGDAEREVFDEILTKMEEPLHK